MQQHHQVPALPQWSDFDTVLLDMDGTLLDLHFDDYFWRTHLVQRLAEEKTLSAEQAQQVITDIVEAARGTQRWYCLDHWSAALDLDVVPLKREVQHLIKALPYAEDFLQVAQSKHGKKVYMATNAHRDSLDLKMQHVPMTHYFDDLISAHDYQHQKEDAGFWQALQQAIGFDPARTVMVDDNTQVLAAARDYGIEHCVAICHPNTQCDPREITDFPAIKNFSVYLQDNA